MTTKNFIYFDNCVHSDACNINRMVDNAVEIQWRTFAKHCDYLPLEKQIAQHVKFKNDWAVSFYKSKFKGKTCYYVRHSSIEYIFLHKWKVMKMSMGAR